MSQNNMPLLQRVVESIPAVLALGILVPGIFYFAWGILEAMTLTNMPTYTFGGK